MIRVLIALVAVIVLIRIGMVFLRGLGQPMPEPPPPGELRKLNLRYRCSLCGAEVRMTLAAAEEPDPPRHCMEDMERFVVMDDL